MQSLWMLVASLLFAIMGGCVKLAASQYSIAEIVFYRSLIGTMATRNLSRLRRRLRVRRVGESFDSSHL